MHRDNLDNARSGRDGDDPEEAEALLSSTSNEDIASPRTPRTPNRVRFDLEVHGSRDNAVNGQIQASLDETAEWMEDEDYLSTQSPGTGRRSSTGQRAPLLTDIEAPSVTVANADLSFDANDLLEGARPKSGMRSAFMNMANSIM